MGESGEGSQDREAEGGRGEKVCDGEGGGGKEKDIE